MGTGTGRITALVPGQGVSPWVWVIMQGVASGCVPMRGSMQEVAPVHRSPCEGCPQRARVPM